jgi:sterol desaturase/sphingolipid hydroxylase (fatty acid hydroxylase superfamily)
VITALTIKYLQAIGLSRFLLKMAIFIPLERLAPHRDAQPVLRDGWLTDLLSYIVNGTLIAIIIFTWNRLIPQIPWIQPLPPLFNMHDQSAVVHGIAILTLGSFVYYWGHRAEHHFACLWRFHSVHHSIEHMDWLATHRGHVFETIYFTILTSIPMSMLGLSAPMTFGFVIYRFFEGQIEHSNVRLPLGPLKWVVPSPWFHHWHHALDVEAQNKNFSPYPFWDVIFGTAYMPEGRIPSRLGVDVPVPKDYFGQLMYPFGLADWTAQLRKKLTTKSRGTSQ